MRNSQSTYEMIWIYTLLMWLISNTYIRVCLCTQMIHIMIRHEIYHLQNMPFHSETCQACWSEACWCGLENFREKSEIYTWSTKILKWVWLLQQSKPSSTVTLRQILQPFQKLKYVLLTLGRIMSTDEILIASWHSGRVAA